MSSVKRAKILQRPTIGQRLAKKLLPCVAVSGNCVFAVPYGHFYDSREFVLNPIDTTCLCRDRAKLAKYIDRNIRKFSKR